MRPVYPNPDVVIVWGVNVVAAAAVAAVLAWSMVNRIREVFPMATMTLRSISWTTLTSDGTLILSIKIWILWINAGFTWTSKIKINPQTGLSVRPQPLSMMCLLQWSPKYMKFSLPLLAWLLISRTRIILWNDWCHKKWRTNLTMTNCSVAMRESLRVQTATMAHLFVDNSSHLREGETIDISVPNLQVLMCVLW